MSKRAIILAGGKGTRLRPYTLNKPKPLMPLNGIALVEILILQLSAFGFDHISLAINQHGKRIQQVLGNGERWNIKLDYSIEDKPLGTIGPIGIMDDLPQNFLLVNGDLLTNWDFEQMFSRHLMSQHAFTIGTYKKVMPFAYGLLETNPGGEIVSFQEKPKKTFLVNAGVYVMNAEILSLIPKEEYYGFDHLIRDMLAEGYTINTFEHHKYWQDIGCPEDYHLADKDFRENPGKFLPKSFLNTRPLVTS